MMIKVSIIVPVYCAEQYLDRCVTSLLNQTLRELEVILVDDGSPDSSGSMCDIYTEDTRVRVIHKKNEGAGPARNSGLAVAQGEFVAFVDSDDYVERTMYETLWTTAQRSRADVIYAGYYRERQCGQVSSVTLCQEEQIFSGRQQVDAFLLDLVGTEPEAHRDSRYGPSVWKALYRRECIQVHQLQFLSERLFSSEDLLFNMDFLSIAESVVAFPQCLYHYCDNSESFSRAYQKDRFAKDKALYQEVCRRLAQRFPSQTYLIRADRLLFGRARVALNEQVQMTASQHDIKKALRNMRFICQDEILHNLYIRYPSKRLSRKYRIIMSLMKHSQVLPLYGLLWVKRRIERS